MRIFPKTVSTTSRTLIRKLEVATEGRKGFQATLVHICAVCQFPTVFQAVKAQYGMRWTTIKGGEEQDVSKRGRGGLTKTFREGSFYIFFAKQKKTYNLKDLNLKENCPIS